ncbi:hypothetical protein AJ79_09027 [Helicocarpus griseus UAMH5409]|uniref:Uncharacterized protein n=1 Tax=Helicocarpus griseus UAMH5409 TaxID=1447875 RepID=A0A2B7WMX7_9EURO|nr:hypothetical protein AJ79_09027 [Helicocarpus griseus UAMH5409]
MSRPHAKRVVSIRGIFGRKASHKDYTAPKGTSHYNMSTRLPSSPIRAKASKISKRHGSTRLGRHKWKITDAKSSKATSSTSVSEGDRLLHGFVDSIDTTRYQIAEEVSQSLAAAEQALEKQLSQTIAKHDEKLNLSRTNRAAIFSPLDPESKSKKSSLSNDKAHSQLSDIANSLSACERSLKSRWKAWVKTQQKIACLAVEILGSDSVTIPPVAREVTGTSSFKKRLASATEAFERQVETKRAMLEGVRKSRDDIGSLAREARKQVNAQEKKSREGKRKQREEICKLARKIIANI